VSGLEELSEKTLRIMNDAIRPPLLIEARAALNEVGIVASRRALENGLALIDAAQTQKRRCDAEQDAAKDEADQALAMAEWDLDGRFVTEGNKTFLVIPAHEVGDQTVAEERRPMTADQRKEWKANEARTLPAVIAATKKLRQAEANTAEARDQVVLAERTFSARKADLNAAIAQLDLLKLAITMKETAA